MNTKIIIPVLAIFMLTIAFIPQNAFAAPDEDIVWKDFGDTILFTEIPSSISHFFPQTVEQISCGEDSCTLDVTCEGEHESGDPVFIIFRTLGLFEFGVSDLTCSVIDTDGIPHQISFTVSVVDEIETFEVVWGGLDDITLEANPLGFISHTLETTAHQEPCADDDSCDLEVSCTAENEFSGPIDIDPISISGDFPFGENDVICTATDTDDVPHQISFTVFVVDEIVTVDVVWVGSTSPASEQPIVPGTAPVSIQERPFSAILGEPDIELPRICTAEDEGGDPIVLTIFDIHINGAFPIGENSVTCEATDEAGDPFDFVIGSLITFPITVTIVPKDIEWTLNPLVGSSDSTSAFTDPDSLTAEFGEIRVITTDPSIVTSVSAEIHAVSSTTFGCEPFGGERDGDDCILDNIVNCGVDHDTDTGFLGLFLGGTHTVSCDVLHNFHSEFDDTTEVTHTIHFDVFVVEEIEIFELEFTVPDDITKLTSGDTAEVSFGIGQIGGLPGVTYAISCTGLLDTESFEIFYDEVDGKFVDTYKLGTTIVSCETADIPEIGVIHLPEFLITVTLDDEIVVFVWKGTTSPFAIEGPAGTALVEILERPFLIDLAGDIPLPVKCTAENEFSGPIDIDPISISGDFPIGVNDVTCFITDEEGDVIFPDAPLSSISFTITVNPVRSEVEFEVPRDITVITSGDTAEVAFTIKQIGGPLDVTYDIHCIGTDGIIDGFEISFDDDADEFRDFFKVGTTTVFCVVEGIGPGGALELESFTITVTSDDDEEIPDDTPKKKRGSGGCADCTPPTLGLNKNGFRLVDNGFIYNGQSVQVERWHTDFPLITAHVGQLNTVEIKVYENQGITNMKRVQFGLGATEIGQPLNDLEVLIEVSLETNGRTDFIGVGDIVILDDDNLIDNDSVTASVSLVECMDDSVVDTCVKLVLHYSYREATLNNIMVVQVSDKARNAGNHFFNDGVTVIGESLNPAPTFTLQNKHTSQQTEDLTLTLTRIDKVNHIWEDEYGVQYLRVSESRYDRITPHGEYECNDPPLSEIKVPTRSNCHFRALTAIWSDSTPEIINEEYFADTMNNTYTSRSDDLILQQNIILEEERAQKILEELQSNRAHHGN